MGSRSLRPVEVDKVQTFVFAAVAPTGRQERPGRRTGRFMFLPPSAPDTLSVRCLARPGAATVPRSPQCGPARTARADTAL